MTLPRWIPTFLAFPLGGLVAVETVGSVEGPVTAAAAGAIAGAAVGAAQWLALRSSGVGIGWALRTAAAISAASALAALATDAGTSGAELALTGAIVGLAIGVAQAPLVSHRIAWVLTATAAWSLGWLTTWAAGIDVERAYVVFGASGALVCTVLTGLALVSISRPAPAAGTIAATS